MKKLLTILIILLSLGYAGLAQPLDSLLPVRGFCIKAPEKKQLKRFLTFIDEEMAPAGINTLILRVDYNYDYKSRPELRQDNPLTEKEVKQLVAACKKHNIQLIPQFNLLGHQSWASKLNKLLVVYPEFDETPHVKMPEKYEWPNPDGLYCKSYCPLHPGVHEVVFDLVDELVEVFETDAFHAGMDEVFYIGDDKCPRCAGLDKAELFAGELTKIRNHLAKTNTRLWIWGDRLIDGKTTGIGMWEGSMNNTHRAIDRIPKDIVICDWHYEIAHPTAPIFAAKGFPVVYCPWRRGAVASEQIDQMVSYRKNSSKTMKDNFQGVVQTVWTSAANFMDNYYKEKGDKENSADCFRAMVKKIEAIQQQGE